MTAMQHKRVILRKILALFRDDEVPMDQTSQTLKDIESELKSIITVADAKYIGPRLRSGGD